VAFCEVCLAELECGAAQRLPPPWFDHDRHEVAGRHVRPTAWRLLEILWRRRGRVVSADSFMTLLYSDRSESPDAHTVPVFLVHLRRALEPTPYRIGNVWGEGWRLLETGEQPKVGAIENDIPLPHAKRLARPGGDKYGLAALQLGQSRTIEGVKLSTLRGSCYNATRAGYGRFAIAAGKDALRVWRIE
jgi:hypothetical protein